MMIDASTRVPLSDGHSIPIVGFGTYLCSTAEAASSVAVALKLGYRHIDTAEYYNNHEGIAEAIAASGIAREELYLVDKLSPGGLFGAPEVTYDEVLALIPRQLQRLQTEYYDLFLLHHAFAKEQRLAQYRALLALQRQGKIRSVGVSNWNTHHLEEIRAAGLPMPAVNQVEVHPWCTQEALRVYCRAQGVVVVAYSSLTPLSTWRAEENQASAKTASDAEPSLLQSITEHYPEKTQAQVLLRWAIQQQIPVIPKSVKEERIASNWQLFDFSLREEDLELLSGLDQNRPLAWPIGNPLDCP